MTYLSIFIFGLVFGLIIMPILDAIGTWLQNIFGLKSVILQKQAELFTVEPEEEVRAVGFQIEDEEDEEEEYDE